MERQIDSILFVEIIQSQGISEIRTYFKDGVTIGTFVGPKDVAMIRYGHDVFHTEEVASHYLKILGELHF